MRKCISNPMAFKQMNDIIFPGITADYFSSLVCTKSFLPALDKVARCFGPNFLLILESLAVCPLSTSPACSQLFKDLRLSGKQGDLKEHVLNQLSIHVGCPFMGGGSASS